VGALFEQPHPWTEAVDGEPPSAASKTILDWLATNGGFGLGKLQIDFSIHVLEADASTPKRTFVKTSDFFEPDCDFVPFPMPSGGALEGESGYACTSDGDCHLIVVHKQERRLYELWRANVSNGTFYGGCAAVWDLTRAYPTTLRGEQCTSADVGGFPIAAMLFSADEVFAGSIDHAIRFILPNARIRKGVYVRPAAHTRPPHVKAARTRPPTECAFACGRTSRSRRCRATARASSRRRFRSTGCSSPTAATWR
jgi:serine/threonine-protein kinase